MNFTHAGRNAFLATVLAAGPVGAAAPALAAQTPTTPLAPDFTASLVARNSGKCADVSGASTANGTNIIQWSCHDGNNQQWRLIPSGGGYYTIRAQHSGKCLDVSGASTANGTNVIQWSCHGGTNQQWRLVQVSGYYYRVVARHSGKCLDVSGASTANGTNIIQWSCHGRTNQQWRLG